MPERPRRDEGGQMMLLSAVLLIFAFLALSSMVARVAQLGSVTTQDQDRPILLEIETVQDAVDALLLDLADPDLELYDQDYLDAVESGLQHLAFLERSRGFDFTWDDLGACAAGAQEISFGLDDGEVKVSVVSTESYLPCPVDPTP